MDHVDVALAGTLAILLVPPLLPDSWGLPFLLIVVFCCLFYILVWDES